MRIRNHPKLIWPPTPGGSHHGAQQLLTSPDNGTLKDVTIEKDSRRPPHRRPDHLTLAVEFQGNEFGVMVEPKQDDPTFIAKLHDKLKVDCISQPMRDVWDEDINF